jgi:hypothetical protein
VEDVVKYSVLLGNTTGSVTARELMKRGKDAAWLTPTRVVGALDHYGLGMIRLSDSEEIVGELYGT